MAVVVAQRHSGAWSVVVWPTVLRVLPRRMTRHSRASEQVERCQHLHAVLQEAAQAPVALFMRLLNGKRARRQSLSRRTWWSNWSRWP